MYSVETKLYPSAFRVLEEDGEIFVGPDRTGNFVILSPELFKVVDLFRQGRTYGEVCTEFDLEPDADDLAEAVSVLEAKGLLSATALSLDEPSEPESAWLTTVGRLAFSKGALLLYTGLTLLALAVCVEDPAATPTRSALLFKTNKSLALIGIAAVSFLTVSFHEIGHMLAARAIGIRSRFSFGNRLWILVAETDLSELWSVPRKRRYIPLLAGMIVDIVSIAVIILVVEGLRRSTTAQYPGAVHVLLAVAFTYVSRLIWQCFLFLRTDLYYVFASAFRCTNLMGHTKQYLRALFKRGGLSTMNDPMTVHETKVVSYYAWFWIVGQIVAVAVLVFITLPISLKYLVAAVATLRATGEHSTWTTVDSIMTALIVVVPWAAGLIMWSKGLLRRGAWGA